MRDSNESLDDFRTRLAAVRLQLLKREPFISYLSLELPTFILAPGDPLCEIIETAATDGRRYFFNLQWCKRLTDPELGFVVGHEVGHVLYLHAPRRDERNPDRWNSACDFVINWLLLHTESLKGLICMPHDPEPIGCFDNQFANLTAEQVYDRLPPELGMPSWDPMITGNGDSNADATDAARGAMARALARTKEYRSRNGQGNTPGEWERVAMEGMQPTVTWQALFQMKTAASGHDSHSWTRPNKRMRPHGYYLPSYRGFCLPKTLFVFDTSGSISEDFLGQMAAELNRLLQLSARSSVTVVTCDTEMHPLGEFRAARKFNPQQHKLVGGGGTDFCAPFEFAVKNRYEQVIYLTDTYGTFPSKPAMRTIWLVPEECVGKVPFGETISIPIPQAK
jgi:predicted metal-dependent peptidase